MWLEFRRVLFRSPAARLLWVRRRIHIAYWACILRAGLTIWAIIMLLAWWWIIWFNYMMSGSKGHVIHACMNKHDFGTRKNMKKQPDQGGFWMFLGLWEHEVRNNPWHHYICLYWSAAVRRTEGSIRLCGVFMHSPVQRKSPARLIWQVFKCWTEWGIAFSYNV